MKYLVTFFNGGEIIAEMEFNNRNSANEWAVITARNLRNMGYIPSLIIKEIKK